MGSPYEYALRLLGGRAYSIRDLTGKLRRRGFPASDISAAVARLERAGLVDDVRFAEHLARGKMVNELASARRVAQLLARKGIDRTVTDAAIARVVADEQVDQRASAERLARKKIAALGALEPRAVRRRLYGYLARRGFSPQEIAAAMRETDPHNGLG